MRAFAKAAVLAAAMLIGALSPAFSQTTNAPPPVIGHGGPITPLGGFVIGSIACAAVSPMIATVVLGRELTISEAYHLTLSCMLGPVGWLLADAMFPPTVTVTTTNTPPPQQPRKPKRVASGRNINIPPSGETRFISNEILLRFEPGTSERARALIVDRLNLTLLEFADFRAQRPDNRALPDRRWAFGGTDAQSCRAGLSRRHRCTGQFRLRRCTGAAAGQAGSASGRCIRAICRPQIASDGGASHQPRR